MLDGAFVLPSLLDLERVFGWRQKGAIAAAAAVADAFGGENESGITPLGASAALELLRAGLYGVKTPRSTHVLGLRCPSGPGLFRAVRRRAKALLSKSDFSMSTLDLDRETKEVFFTPSQGQGEKED